MKIDARKMRGHLDQLPLPNITKRFSKNLLVVGCDDVELWGGVFAKQGKSLSMLVHGSVSLTSEGHHLDTLLQVLKTELEQRSLGNLPQKAILASVDLTSMVVEIPLSPEDADENRGHPPEALEEMFRWEMEPALSQRQSSWFLGNVFVAHQWMDRGQLQQLINTQKTQLERHGQSDSIGELALRDSLIVAGQLEHALNFQRRARQTDEGISCAWVAIDEAESSLSPLNVFEEESLDPETGVSGTRWLAGGLYDHHRRLWQKRFLEQGVELIAMHPLVGSSVGSKIESDGRHFLLEVYSGVVGCSEFEQGRLKSLQVNHGLDHEVVVQCLDLLDGVLFDEKTSLELRGAVNHLPEFASELASQLQQALDISRCDVVEADALTIEAHARFSSLATLAKFEFGMAGGGALLAYSTRPELKAMSRRIGAWWAGVASAVLLGLVSIEAAHYIQLRDIQADTAFAKTAVREKESVIEKVSHTNGEVDDIKQELKAVVETRDQLEKKRQLFRDQMTKRQHFVRELLPLLSSRMPADVLLNRITDREGIISVQAWSVSDASAQQFLAALALPLAEYALVTANESITPQEGPFGKPGQRVTFEFAQGTASSKAPRLGVR